MLDCSFPHEYQPQVKGKPHYFLYGQNQKREINKMQIQMDKQLVFLIITALILIWAVFTGGPCK